MPIIEMKGLRFGKLTVISQVKRTDTSIAYWRCRCECGGCKDVIGSSLRNNSVRSCGCMQRESVTTHGQSHCKLHRIWYSMNSRVSNINHEHYADYGGRGIKVHKLWTRSYESFRDYVFTLPNCPDKELLLSLKGPRLKLSIDRINNNGNYRPGNLRWATSVIQNNNRRGLK